MIFRFDDVCINSHLDLHRKMTDFLNKRGIGVMWAVSPLVFNDDTQRIYPKELNPLSDYREYFKVNEMGMPEVSNLIIRASHGLIHVDHRLLHKSAQEMSIITSCSICDTRIFVPPFNKWNKDTEEVCRENGIELIKFEDGWLSMEHNKFIQNHDKWYLHARAFTFDSFKKWFE